MKRIYRLLLSITLMVLFISPAFCLIDINTASQSELESLPGIGAVKAERIIAGRPYRSVNDLTRVKGIGSKTVNKFRDRVTVGAPKKEKEKAPAEVVERKPVEVPVYSTESYKTLKCHKCKNRFRVSGELKSGWCPYCRTRWAVAGAKSAAKDSSPKPAAKSGVISWEVGARYVNQTKTVEGPIVGTHLSSGSGNLYLNFHSDYQTYLSIKIPASDLGKFPPNAQSYYQGKKVIAKGLIKKEKGGKYLRLIVTDPKDLIVVE